MKRHRQEHYFPDDFEIIVLSKDNMPFRRIPGLKSRDVSKKAKYIVQEMGDDGFCCLNSLRIECISDKCFLKWKDKLALRVKNYTMYWDKSIVLTDHPKTLWKKRCKISNKEYKCDYCGEMKTSRHHSMTQPALEVCFECFSYECSHGTLTRPRQIKVKTENKEETIPLDPNAQTLRHQTPQSKGEPARKILSLNTGKAPRKEQIRAYAKFKKDLELEVFYGEFSDLNRRHVVNAFIKAKLKAFREGQKVSELKKLLELERSKALNAKEKHRIENMELFDEIKRLRQENLKQKREKDILQATLHPQRLLLAQAMRENEKLKSENRSLQEESERRTRNFARAAEMLQQRIDSRKPGSTVIDLT